MLPGPLMSRTLQSSRHQALKVFLVMRRIAQAKVAKKLRRYQSFVATVEGGQRKLDVVSFLPLLKRSVSIHARRSNTCPASDPTSCRVQYSAASIRVMTRSVTAGFAGFGEWKLRFSERSDPRITMLPSMVQTHRRHARPRLFQAISKVGNSCASIARYQRSHCRFNLAAALMFNTYSALCKNL
jgi:hypothetical protein